MKKVAKAVKEEPKKEEVKKVKVKVAKAKKYEDLPEIPDYERAVLEVYEESEFDLSKGDKGPPEAITQVGKPTATKLEVSEPAKNGLPKVSFVACTVAIYLNT